MNYKIDRRIIKNEAEKRLNESETQKVESKIELLQKQEEAHDMSPDDDWEIDFEKCISLNRDLCMQSLEGLKEVIYNNSGWLTYNTDGRKMSSDELMFCHAYDLIEFEDDDKRRIYITDKGKYFLKRASWNNAVDEDGE